MPGAQWPAALGCHSGITSWSSWPGLWTSPIKYFHYFCFITLYMMTSSNIFRVTAPSWGESTGHRWIPLTGASDEKLWRFFDLRLNKWLNKQWRRRLFETPSRSSWCHRNAFYETKLIPLACINSLPFNGANSNRCITPYDLPISANYAESKHRYKFHMFLLCCMYHIGSNREIPKVDLIAI